MALAPARYPRRLGFCGTRDAAGTNGAASEEEGIWSTGAWATADCS